MKKKLVLVVLLSLLLSLTARADITSQLSTAEEILGVDNSGMKTVERVGALEEALLFFTLGERRGSKKLV